MFKWSCLAAAVLSLVGMGWIVNDLRLEAKKAAVLMNENLPRILENTKKSTETLAALSQDMKNLRDLAGVRGGHTDRSFVTFADEILDALEKSGGQVGLMPKLFGKELKETVDVKEWVVGARKEALWLSFRVRSRRELWEKISHNMYGSAWYLHGYN